MKKYSLSALALVGLFLLLGAQSAYAGTVYGASVVGYNTSTRQIIGYSATWTDYELSYYYDPEVQGELYWQYDNERPLDSGHDVGFSDPYAPIPYQIPAGVWLFSSSYRPVTTYFTYSNHFLSPYYVDDYGYFYDPFQYFLSSGGDFGGYFGIPDFGFNPYNYIYFGSIYVFSTGVGITTPSDACRIPGTNFDENGRPCPGGITPAPTPPSSLSVTIESIVAVPKKGAATVHIGVTPLHNTTPITLTIAKDPGTTGSATFDDGTLNRQITETTTLTVKGVTESSAKDNMSLTATANGATLAKIKFSVLWVELSLRYGSNLTVSNDNAAKSNYIARLGTDRLGTFHDLNPVTPFWVTSVEIVGSVSPHDFTGFMPIIQEVVSFRSYNDKTVIQKGGGYIDVRDPLFFDDDPQSGMSDGKVYGLDAPGIGSLPAHPVGTILRNRTNFRTWAMFGTMKVSDDLNWFSRLSIRKTAEGDVLSSNAAIEIRGGDNIAGLGTTRLTWDLGEERLFPPFGASVIDDSRTYTAWLYRDFFDREPDQGGWDAWTNVITQCGSDTTCIHNKEAFVGLNFILSNEFINMHPELSLSNFGTHAFNESYVEQCYQVFLRRPSDQGGKAAWVQVLDNTAPNTSYSDYEQIISGFIGSTEYRVRFPTTDEQ